jgi:hypothetical protein
MYNDILEFKGSKKEKKISIKKKKERICMRKEKKYMSICKNKIK